MTRGDLSRFIDAQADTYDTALAEIRSSQKRSHWMWFIFPQLRGLGHSPTAQHYGIISLDESRSNIAHPQLGPRYRICVEAVNALETSDPVAIFGTTDAMKLRSSLVLFEAAEPSPLIQDVLNRFYDAERDAATQQMLSLSAKAMD